MGIIKGKELIDGTLEEVKLSFELAQKINSNFLSPSIRTDANTVESQAGIYVYCNDESINYPSEGGCGFRIQRSTSEDINASQSIIDFNVPAGSTYHTPIYFRKSYGDGRAITHPAKWEQVLTTSNSGIIYGRTSDAYDLTSGSSINILELRNSLGSGYKEVSFQTSINAIETPFGNVAFSGECFASCSVSILKNNIPQNTFILQIPRKGITATDLHTFSIRTILSLNLGDIVSISISANEAGCSIPSGVISEIIIK